MAGLVAYGAYIPYWRLQRSAITGALGSGGGKGARSVASFDEDTTSLGVEAGRNALAMAGDAYRPNVVAFATTAPAYADKTNATVIHAALGLDRSAAAFDTLGATRSGVAAMEVAQAMNGLAVLSDIRTGLAGGADESNGGDAAVVWAFGEGDPIAHWIGGASASAEFVDRWREPGAPNSKQWEERFGEFAYVPLAEEAIGNALKSAGLAIGDLDRVIITGLHTRAVGAVRKSVGASAAADRRRSHCRDRQHRHGPLGGARGRRVRHAPSPVRRSSSPTWPTDATSASSRSTRASSPPAAGRVARYAARSRRPTPASTTASS